MCKAAWFSIVTNYHLFPPLTTFLRQNDWLLPPWPSGCACLQVLSWMAETTSQRLRARANPRAEGYPKKLACVQGKTVYQHVSWDCWRKLFSAKPTWHRNSYWQIYQAISGQTACLKLRLVSRCGMCPSPIIGGWLPLAPRYVFVAVTNEITYSWIKALLIHMHGVSLSLFNMFYMYLYIYIYIFRYALFIYVYITCIYIYIYT